MQVQAVLKKAAGLDIETVCSLHGPVLHKEQLADVLAAQGLPAHLEIWGGDVSHEWYWWGKMLGLFVPRILEK